MNKPADASWSAVYFGQGALMMKRLNGRVNGWRGTSHGSLHVPRRGGCPSTGRR